jgi:hypothetical protein|tara:strand:- start:22 stop:231 length:210 start_codon:yes stop_codon:yes gene_type:complete
MNTKTSLMLEIAVFRRWPSYGCPRNVLLGYPAKPIFPFCLSTYTTYIAGWITACEAVDVVRISVGVGLT